MHFGMIVKECLLSAEIASPDDPDLTALYKKMRHFLYTYNDTVTL